MMAGAAGHRPRHAHRLRRLADAARAHLRRDPRPDAAVSYAVNVFIFFMGRVRVGAAPIVDGERAATLANYADPLPQALVLTAIVISFAMTAVMLVIALRTHACTGSDHVDGVEPARTRRRHESGTRQPGTAEASMRNRWRYRGTAGSHDALDRRAGRAAADVRRAAAADRRPRARHSRRGCRRRHGGAAGGDDHAAAASRRGSVQAYLLGNWRAPFGIALVLDRLSALMLAADRRGGAGGPALRPRWRRPPRPALPRSVPVPVDGPERRVPDRRPVQPVRLLRGAADLILRPVAARRRRGAAQSIDRTT